MHRASGYPRGRGERNVTTRNRSGEASLLRDSAHELRTELARKIALFIGSAENRATDIPGLTLHRRTAPTAPCSMTYEPSVTVIAQGRKRVELGRNVFIYDASRFLLTSVDLPVVSRVIEASEQVPCLALSLKLEMPVVREVLSREEIQVAEAPSDSPGMATGVTTVEFLSACCQRGDACSWMVWTPQVRPLRSDTKAPANSTESTAVSSANPRCGIFELFARQALRRWSRSTMGKNAIWS